MVDAPDEETIVQAGLVLYVRQKVNPFRARSSETKAKQSVLVAQRAGMVTLIWPKIGLHRLPS